MATPQPLTLFENFLRRSIFVPVYVPVSLVLERVNSVWNVQAKNDWDADTYSDGKKMQVWAGNEILEQLDKTYSGFNLDDSCKSLFSSIDFFRKLSTETAKLLGYKYPEQVDKNITGWIENIGLKF